MRSPWLYLRTVLPFQLAAWACRIGVVYFVLEAFRIEAGFATAALVVVLNGAATAVPVPGGAGSQQVLATYALQGVISTAAAVSFSLSMQVGVTAVNTAVGLAAVMVLFRTLRPVAAAACGALELRRLYTSRERSSGAVRDYRERGERASRCAEARVRRPRGRCRLPRLSTKSDGEFRGR